MFQHIFAFEINYWLRRPMVYIFALVFFTILMLVICADGISIGGRMGDVHLNAPYVVQNWFSGMLLINLLMTAAFMQGAALRDFDNNTYQIVFASPISRASYFFGRFLGAATAWYFGGKLAGSAHGLERSHAVWRYVLVSLF
jgi:ABC-2 type transport system permease protein